jgi:hypothetical protein
MLVSQWVLSLPEMREFLPMRITVIEPEAWMSRVDAMTSFRGGLILGCFTSVTSLFPASSYFLASASAGGRRSTSYQRARESLAATWIV